MLNNTPTVGDLVKYILENRRGKVFQGYNEETVHWCVSNGITNKTLVYSSDGPTITGVLYATLRPVRKSLFVWHILTTKPKVMNQLILQLATLWPNHTAEAERHDRLVQYTNTTKLISKLQ